MVSSTVYDKRDLLDQIYAILTGYGYEVWMSHKGTIPTNPGKDNFENCLMAVKECDLFLGIITGWYGSGKTADGPSILHQEIRLAIEKNKIRWFLIHRDVEVARILLKQFRLDERQKPLPLNFKKTPILDDIRVLDMLDEVHNIQNWAHEFSDMDNAKLFIENQLQDLKRIKGIVKQKASERPGAES